MALVFGKNKLRLELIKHLLSWRVHNDFLPLDFHSIDRIGFFSAMSLPEGSLIAILEKFLSNISSGLSPRDAIISVERFRSIRGSDDQKFEKSIEEIESNILLGLENYCIYRILIDHPNAQYKIMKGTMQSMLKICIEDIQNW